MEAVLGIIEAWNRGDRQAWLAAAHPVRAGIEAIRSDDLETAIETVIELADPSIEFTSVMAAVEPKTYRGHEGMRRYFSDMAESWKEWEMDVEEVVPVAPDAVLATFTSRLVGKDSGIGKLHSRRAVSRGYFASDVARERGGRSTRVRGVQRGRTWRRCVSYTTPTSSCSTSRAGRSRDLPSDGMRSCGSSSNSARHGSMAIAWSRWAN